MGLFTSINVASTGMSVQRLRTDVISNNIANATSTRTQEGGAYRRQSVIVEPIASKNPVWRTPFLDEAKDNGPGLGVRVREITKDTEQGRMVYDPTHPDAIQSGPNKGYVEYPNVNIVNEMVDMISANRAYEANSSVIQGSKEMFASALDIGSR
ncbi:flagellar basal body rod protein FlgC [Treponema sp.]|uniref:flagellar basal body rod protein FlgC n=1 Tax=Treponema sp. TaxID=166 RepID=UPI00298ECAA4|nr:flagellar basal body rod protein FlgC [Treponema sp.]MCQ2241313.1 flagellar basal body rod protein FlgC [Treponema sp.]